MVCSFISCFCFLTLTLHGQMANEIVSRFDRLLSGHVRCAAAMIRRRVVCAANRHGARANVTPIVGAGLDHLGNNTYL